jgi:hypothetical protein
MTLALGLLAMLFGADLVISGITKRPVGRLAFGYWDAPGGNTATATSAAPGNAATGGVYAPQLDTQHGNPAALGAITPSNAVGPRTG